MIAIYINFCFAEQGSETSKRSSTGTVEGIGTIGIIAMAYYIN